MNKKHLGSSFDDFLREQKLFESVEAGAIKRVIAFKLEKERARLKLSKADMARRMKTSRAALDRLLDPKNSSATLASLERAASAVGRRIRLDLV